jgi:hypothetical protein
MSKSFRPIATSLRQILALALVIGLAAGPAAPLFAQTVPAAPMMLHITILDGEDSLNNIRERTAREPIVQVEDENHKPVAGALLIFSIQNGGTGAGGSFNGLSTLSVTTDSEGKAIAHGLKPNATSGSYTIGVTATLGALVATAVIHQSNVLGGGGGGAAPPSAPVTPGAPVAPVAPGAPGAPVAPVAPGAPVAPVAPGAPVAPVAPGAPVTPGTPVTPSGTTTSGTEGPPSSGGGPTRVTRVPRIIRHIPKKVWITGTVVVVTGVVIGTVVATRGSSSTTITPGTGTVGP